MPQVFKSFDGCYALAAPTQLSCEALTGHHRLQRARKTGACARGTRFTVVLQQGEFNAWRLALQESLEPLSNPLVYTIKDINEAQGEQAVKSSSGVLLLAGEAEAAKQRRVGPEMLGANVKIADEAKVEGEKGVEAGVRRLQHRHNIYGACLALADCMCRCHSVPHACTSATWCQIQIY